MSSMPTPLNHFDLTSEHQPKKTMVSCRKIMAQTIACATELAVVLFSLQTALLLCWNIFLVFQKVMNANPQQIFSVQNEILQDDFMVLLTVTCFLSEAIVGLATAHQLHRWNKNCMRIKISKHQKKPQIQASAPFYPYATVPEEARPLLLYPADIVQPPAIPPPDFFVSIPTIHTMPLEGVSEPVKKEKKGIRVSELTWMVIWITAIVVTATACKAIPLTLGCASVFAFFVNLMVGETEIGVRKKNKKSLELPEVNLKERVYWRSDPVTECVLWMQALLSFCKFMHHSVLVGVLFLTIPLDNMFFVVVSFLIGVSFVVFRQYMFYIFREKCKHYYQAIVKKK